jgi:hypothetical protein
MLWRILATIVVLLHVLSIAFIVLGGFLTWRWRRVAWVHVPFAVWGMLLEYYGWICPLTPLENHFREKAGLAGYHEGFIEHYILPVIYPANLSVNLQLVLGTVVLVVNAVAYAGMVMRGRSRS